MELLTARRFSALRCVLLIGAGLVFGLLLCPSWWLGLVAAGVGFLLAFLISEKFLYISLATLAASYGALSVPPPPSPDIFGVPLIIEGSVSEDKEGGYSVLAIESPSPLKGRLVLLYLAGNEAAGTRIGVKGEILPLSFPQNPGMPSRNLRLTREGIIGRVKESELRILSPPRGVYLWLAAARERVLKRCEEIFGPEAALYSAILLGKTELVSERIFSDMRRTGTLHLLAVSGLNVGVLVAFLAFLFRLLGLGRKWSVPLLVVLLAAYIGLVGPCSSIIRSSIMCLAVAIGFLIDRKTLPLNNLALAALAIVVWKPVQILDIGFQLSFAATFAIILAADFVSEATETFKAVKIPSWLIKWIILPVALSLSATIFTMPFLAANFHQVTFLSVLANLPAVPLVSLIFPLGLVALLFSIMWLPLGEILGYIVSAGLWLLEKILGILPGNLSPSVSWPAALVISLFAAAMLLHTEKNKKYRFTLSLGILLLGANAGFWPWALESRKPTLTLLDTYEGNVAVLESYGRTVLFNPGSKAENTVRNYLNSRGISSIDMVLCLSDKQGDLSGLDSIEKYYRVGVVGSLEKLDQRNSTLLPHTGLVKLPSMRIEYDLAVRSRPFYLAESKTRKVIFASENERVDSTAINYLLNNRLRSKIKGVSLVSKERIKGLKTRVVRETGGIIIDL